MYCIKFTVNMVAGESLRSEWFRMYYTIIWTLLDSYYCFMQILFTYTACSVICGQMIRSPLSFGLQNLVLLFHQNWNKTEHPLTLFNIAQMVMEVVVAEEGQWWWLKFWQRILNVEKQDIVKKCYRQNKMNLDSWSSVLKEEFEK
jgi:hypothetical protein